MSNFKNHKFSELGCHYGGLSNKRKEDFGYGKPYISYLNIFENVFVDSSKMDYVNISGGEHQNKVKKGDIFFTTSSETAEEVGMTSVLLDDLGETYLNSFCFGFRLNDFKVLLPEYAGFLFRSEGVRKRISSLAQGSTRYNLSKTIFFDKLYLDLPSMSFQRKIAQILTTVDKVIERTENAIEKLKKIKQGMTHDLFTRGIDVKTGKLRPSYSEVPELYKETELGWIPKGWSPKTFSDICVINQGLQIAISNRYKHEGNNRFVYITIQYLNDPENGSNRFYIEDPATSVICYEDDILMTRTGNTGIVVSNIVGVFHNNFFKIKYQKDNQKDFIIYYLERPEIQTMILNYAGTTTIPDLKHDDFYRLPYPQPEKLEQEEIVRTIKSIDVKIDTEIIYFEKAKKLQNGLMQDLLTGKVEVTPDPQDKEYQEVS
ncbi:MAG: restriction endonuclease subunit S [Candidatus Omnitrophica bacterium]|nr:restriction endonuclease subunit S [Candidatus Omnitrophota bacterium]